MIKKRNKAFKLRIIPYSVHLICRNWSNLSKATSWDFY